MSRMRIGQVLERMGKLSGHDIDEILHEQSSNKSGKAFGEIALQWGLVQPEHIWRAWADQLGEGAERVDLNEVGIDAQATARLPRELAHRFCAMPVRLVDDEVVIAVSDAGHVPVLEELQHTLGSRAHFVLAEAGQIREMIGRYYPASALSA